MEHKYDIAIRAHEKAMPTIDEITETLSELVRKKALESGSKSKRVSTFRVDVAAKFFTK